MIKFVKRLASVTALLFIASQAMAEYVVVVNPSNTANLTKEDVAKLFLAKTKAFPDGSQSKPVNHEENNEARSNFDQSVLEKSPSQMKAYWSRLLFTGKAVPIEEMSSDADIINFISKNPDAIGYIDAANVTPDVKVLFSY